MRLFKQSAAPTRRPTGQQRFQLVYPVAVLIALLSLPACQTRPMNKQEAAEWYAKAGSFVRWVGYRGSDGEYHHFIARIGDDWGFIQIRRDELTVGDERPYSTISNGPLYYYLVDPNRDYGKIEGTAIKGAAARSR